MAASVLWSAPVPVSRAIRFSSLPVREQGLPNRFFGGQYQRRSVGFRASRRKILAMHTATAGEFHQKRVAAIKCFTVEISTLLSSLKCPEKRNRHMKIRQRAPRASLVAVVESR